MLRTVLTTHLVVFQYFSSKICLNFLLLHSLLHIWPKFKIIDSCSNMKSNTTKRKPLELELLKVGAYNLGGNQGFGLVTLTKDGLKWEGRRKRVRESFDTDYQTGRWYHITELVESSCKLYLFARVRWLRLKTPEDTTTLIYPLPYPRSTITTPTELQNVPS